MFKNYLVVAFRNIWKYKYYSILNVLGLSIALASVILIWLYIRHEESFDLYNQKADRIYRVYLDGKNGDENIRVPATPVPLAGVLARDYPEVEKTVRLCPRANQKIAFFDRLYFEDNLFYTDSTFFDIFDTQFVSGNKDALKKPYSMVITDVIAKKYFGDFNPIGRKLQIINNDTTFFTITAVVKPLPSNSHFQFDFLVSTLSDTVYNRNTWTNNNIYTYLLLKKGANPAAVDAKLVEMVTKYISPMFEQNLGISYDEFLKSGKKFLYKLQKITDIHLHSHMDYEPEESGNILYIYIFLAIGLFILFNAIVNFVNLSTANLANRAGEIGQRKAIGASPMAIRLQFLFESVTLTILALILAIQLVYTALPYFSMLVNQPISFDNHRFLRSLPFLLLFAIVVGVLAGGYPAFYLSSLQPVKVIKGKQNLGKSNGLLRSVLIILQFTVSIFILQGTMIIAKQMLFVQTMKLGFDKDHLLVIERTNPIRKKIVDFMDDIRDCPAVKDVTLSSSVPGRSFNITGFISNRSGRPVTVFLTNFAVDSHYAETMGLKLIEGRFFSADIPSDTMAVVINEAAAREIGIDKLNGDELRAPGFNRNDPINLHIIGIIKDFNYESLHKPVNPLVLSFNNSAYDGYITLKIKAGENDEAVNYISKTWQRLTNETNVQYYYYQQDLNRLYQPEFRIRRFMIVFSCLAGVIAVLGLIGLISFITERRSKEIGVRKVFGSNVFNIVLLVSKNTIFLVLLSFVLATIASCFAAGIWLQQFAYKISLHPLLFLIAGGISLLVTAVAISFQVIRVSLKNPVESLRYE